MEGKEDPLLVISGGVTRPGLPSEAEGAMALVPENLRSVVRLEKKSLSTRQNLRFTRELLRDTRIDSLIVVSGYGQEQRARFLFRTIWPEVFHKLSFESVGRDTFREYLLHKLLYLLTVIDPQEKVFLPMKKYVFK